MKTTARMTRKVISMTESPPRCLSPSGVNTPAKKAGRKYTEIREERRRGSASRPGADVPGDFGDGGDPEGGAAAGQVVEELDEVGVADGQVAFLDAVEGVDAPAAEGGGL